MVNNGKLSDDLKPFLEVRDISCMYLKQRITSAFDGVLTCSYILSLIIKAKHALIHAKTLAVLALRYSIKYMK